MGKNLIEGWEAKMGDLRKNPDQMFPGWEQQPSSSDRKVHLVAPFTMPDISNLPFRARRMAMQANLDNNRLGLVVTEGGHELTGVTVEPKTVDLSDPRKTLQILAITGFVGTGAGSTLGASVFFSRSGELRGIADDDGDKEEVTQIIPGSQQSIAESLMAKRNPVYTTGDDNRGVVFKRSAKYPPRNPGNVQFDVAVVDYNHDGSSDDEERVLLKGVPLNATPETVMAFVRRIVDSLQVCQ